MKNLYVTLLLLLANFSLSAQNVSIPDSNFKDKLIALGIDLNNDGSIQTSEALMVEELDISNASIISLSGIENFTNLKRLNCNNNLITNLSLTAFELYELRCSNNKLTELNDISSQTTELDVSYNNLNALKLPESVNYNYLDISGNNYTSIEFNDVKLNFFSCNDSKLTALDFSNVRQLSETISIKNNPNLEAINFRNGKFDLCYVMLGGCHFYLILNNNPSLEFICTDEFEYKGPTIVTETEYFQSYYNLPNVKFNSYCTSNTDRALSVENSINKAQNFTFYPNPVQDNLTIEMENLTTVSSINVYNTIGQLVKNIAKPALSKQIGVALSDLKTGSYFIEVVSNQGKSTKKLLKL
ncbi:T9SS type A sorting domain-containing protein [Flavobacterium luteum]|uniref:T9SS type A sorting domain-containing protein n=1 Tax=Flavobacterium luteum TaxID=2026654 RepID=A0A7J5AK59_9FLAO|nr:T9SS type A sorting domain-containing protein [Flavobacterium luteum]KAB1157992.1 T9SS type A sorting domain-containing protein [Flavobacterium luteum]